MTKDNNSKGIILIIIAMTLFAMQDSLIKYIFEKASLYEIFFGRYFVAAVLLFSYIKFKKQKVVVRSSALGEDTIETSNAGVFTSILNVIPSKNTLQKSIERVIKSYNKKKHFNLNNQVIVQRQSTHIKTSGVIFTRISDTGAPYYIINYEDGKNTDSVLGTSSTVNGLSVTEIDDGTEATTAALQVKIIGITKDPENDDASMIKEKRYQSIICYSSCCWKLSLIHI